MASMGAQIIETKGRPRVLVRCAPRLRKRDATLTTLPSLRMDRRPLTSGYPVNWFRPNDWLPFVAVLAAAALVAGLIFINAYRGPVLPAASPLKSIDAPK
jgi:hypothetical protein